MSTPAPLHMTVSSPSWPSELETIDGPPTELWVAGRTEALSVRPRVAIVGSRTPTPYGEAQARRFATRLAEHGVCIVSGLARGIDQAAHEAALEVEGWTMAVLGSGIDRPWPRGRLTDRLGAEGLLMTEFPPGLDPRRHHFPLRNRLISGLSSVVLVIEAARASGSLITARWASDQGKEVFALPGRVDHPMARGCHRLLREGARLLEDPGEVLEELGLSASSDEGSPAPASPLLDALEGETLTVDELCQRLGVPVSEVLGQLVGLELDGWVVRAPGGLYRLARPGRTGRTESVSRPTRRGARGRA